MLTINPLLSQSGFIELLDLTFSCLVSHSHCYYYYFCWYSVLFIQPQRYSFVLVVFLFCLRPRRGPFCLIRKLLFLNGSAVFSQNLLFLLPVLSEPEPNHWLCCCYCYCHCDGFFFLLLLGSFKFYRRSFPCQTVGRFVCLSSSGSVA